MSKGLALVLVAVGVVSAQAPPPPAAAKAVSVRMADSVMARHADPLTIDAVRPKWEYTQGLVLKAIFAVGEKTGDSRYFDYARRYYDEMIGADGAIRT